MLIDDKSLATFVAQIFVAKGLTQEHARTIAQVLVWADLRGADSHGVSRIAAYLAFIERGVLVPNATPVTRDLTPAAFVIEGHGTAGPIVMSAATGKAVAAAKTMGICIGVVSGSTHMGAIGYYAQMAARQGCAAIVMAAGVPIMAYHGARVPSVSTAPIAIGVPAPHEPLVLDMATGVAAMGRIRQAAKQGLPLPEGWALDEDGAPTTDANKAFTGLALGGPKGSGLALMFEILTGVIAGAPALLSLLGKPKSRHVQNATIIAIDIATFREPKDFAADVEALAQKLKEMPKIDGIAEILMPGERGARMTAQQREAGISIPAKQWAELTTIADGLGIAVPASK